MSFELRDMGLRVPRRLISFGSALEEAGALTDGWPYFLEKPYKWESEYGFWTTVNSPHEGDGEEWAKFCAYVERS